MREFSCAISLFGDQKTKSNDSPTTSLETDTVSRESKRQSEVSPGHTLLDGDQSSSPSDLQGVSAVAPRHRTTYPGSDSDKIPLTDDDQCTKEIDNNVQQNVHQDKGPDQEQSLTSRRRSRYDDDDFQLDRSILLTRPEKWFSTRRSQAKPSNFPDLPAFSRRMQNNPYVGILASKSRLCANWRVKLPSNLLQELSVFKLVKDASSTLSTACDAMVSDRKDGVIDYVYLPLEPESKKNVVGASTYHVLKRQHVRRASWKHLKYIRTMSGVPSERLGWAPDMDSLIERRLRRRLEICARNLRLSGVSGFYIDEKKANEEGIVIVELSWLSVADAKGNLKDSEFYYNETHSAPVIRYFVNQLCGFETSSVLRECLTDVARKASGTGDIVSWPTSIFVTENANTRNFLMHLWRLRVYIGDRVD
ncbi:hypothetical protein V1525DRAFT_346285 [Lipomyces kononenkoae]|uniref:Uncharacterized protein n=1 Tax=Lipomyces kononenkoae TaxID=34357 RepID=A0ACC3SZZ1_LIPKO